MPVSATPLARCIDAADVPMPNVLSARHLARIGGGRLEVRAVVTDHGIASRILDAIPTTARPPPPLDSTVVYEPAFA